MVRGLLTVGDYAAPRASRATGLVALARIDGSPSVLGGTAHMILMTRYRLGDLAAAESRSIRRPRPISSIPDFACGGQARAPQTFGTAVSIAWLMGRHNEADRHATRTAFLGQPFDRQPV